MTYTFDLAYDIKLFFVALVFLYAVSRLLKD